MEGQFLVRQIYDDEITYNIIGAAVEILSKFIARFYKKNQNPTTKIEANQYCLWSKYLTFQILEQKSCHVN